VAADYTGSRLSLRYLSFDCNKELASQPDLLDDQASFLFFFSPSHPVYTPRMCGHEILPSAHFRYLTTGQRSIAGER